jgi:hypothetical protein
VETGIPRHYRPITARGTQHRTRTVAFSELVAAAWLVGVLGVVVLVLPDYGTTWDEHWHRAYGDLLLEWLLQRGDGALSYRRDFLYGGGFDLLAAVGRSAGVPSHASIAAVGIVGIAATYVLTRAMAGPVAALVAMVLLTITPTWWGSMFNNPKDVPFAVGYLFGVLALVRWVRRFPRGGASTHAALGVALGLACCVRVGGGILIAIFIATIVAFAVARAIRTRSLARGLELASAQWKRVAITIAIAWAIMIAAWPWAQLNPLGRPLLAAIEMSRFQDHQRTMMFAGEPMHTTDPRWDYLLHYFGLQLPVLVLVGIAIAIAIAALAYKRCERAQTRQYAILTAAILLPPIYAIAAGSILYDGLRHFLFLVPLLVVVAAIGIVHAARLLARPLPLIAAAGVLGATWLAIGQARAMIELHPHQYVYFNQLAGGLPGAAARYDTDYYGNSYEEAYAKLFDHLWREDPQRFLDSDFVVSACMPEFVADEYLPPNARWSDGPGIDEMPDFYIGYTRGDCHNAFPHTPVLVKVERQGAVLNVVRDLRRHPFRGNKP